MLNIRIVSLVPSLTETLSDFGLQNNIVGCTSFCVSPKTLRKSTATIGGTKDPDLKKIAMLSPTHIIVNEEENTPEIRNTLKSDPQFKNSQIIETFPKSVNDSINMINELGKIFSCEEYTKKWIENANKLLLECKKEMQVKIPYIYFIWRKPWMIAGDKTYISAMLNLVGFQNQIITKNNMNARYPVFEKNDENLKRSQVLFFSSEPYPFKKRHAEEFIKEFHFPQCKFLMVDGQNLSWYGTRTLNGLSYVLELKKQVSSLLL